MSNLENKSVVTTLWSGSATIGDTITLSDSYKNYKLLIINSNLGISIIRDSSEYFYWGVVGTGVNLSNTYQSISIDYGYAKKISNTSLTILNSGFAYEIINTSSFINKKTESSKGATINTNVGVYSPRSIFAIYGIK